jgi:hypothetical protein
VEFSILALPAALFAFGLHVSATGWRERFLRALVVFGAATVLITEMLGAMALLSRAGVLAVWLSLAAVAAYRRKPLSRFPRPDAVTAALVAAALAVAVGVAFAAIASAPNSADAMAYHLPRIMYWVQARSVDSFPTSYLNQIMLQPMAEYVALHAYLLSGSDRWTNLVQWSAMWGCVVAVSLIAGALGAQQRGQAIAALMCATIPNGILQASGAKNDYVLGLWLASTLYLGLQCSRLAGVAAALALFTKGTAYLYLPPVLALVIYMRGRAALRLLPVFAAATLVLNGPLYWRNFDLSGSPLGFDSAQGDGFFRWRNDRLGWRETLSNALRHTSDQLGGASDAWNRSVHSAVTGVHEIVGIRADDPATTWRWTKYEPPRNSNHETNAQNRWHLLLLLLSAAALWRRTWSYSLAVIGAFLLFCFYLKWQPFQSRMLLPLFVLATPLAGLALERLRPILQVTVCLVLLNNARPYLFENWTRPLKGPNTVLRTAAEEEYFNDLTQWNNREQYLRAVQAISNAGCTRVGVDGSLNHIEYPLQALLLARRPDTLFKHVNVKNASSKYEPHPDFEPCAIVCIDCERWLLLPLE